MNLSSIGAYLRNCGWLWLPPLIVSFTLWSRLPPAFQPDIFWLDIPTPLGMAENVLRMLVILLPWLMPLQLATATHKAGLALYLAGLVLYAASQLVLALAPESAWSMSIFGFTAAAYTTLPWILGIGMMGDRLFFRQIPWHPWAFYALTLAFVATHTTHAALIYLRNY